MYFVIKRPAKNLLAFLFYPYGDASSVRILSFSYKCPSFTISHAKMISSSAFTKPVAKPTTSDLGQYVPYLSLVQRNDYLLDPLAKSKPEVPHTRTVPLLHAPPGPLNIVLEECRPGQPQ